MKRDKVFLLICFSSFIFSTVDAKVSLYLHYFNCPEFLKYQVRSFEKFLEDEYEIIVYNDSIKDDISKSIERECNIHNVKHIRVPSWVWEKPYLPKKTSYLGGPSFDCVCSIQWIYDLYIRNSPDTCVLLDNDMFLIEALSFEKEFTDGVSFIYYPQSRRNDEGTKIIKYMLPNFLVLQPSKMLESNLLDFNIGIIEGLVTDSGGNTHWYLNKYYGEGKVTNSKYLFHLNQDPYLGQFSSKYPLLFGSKEWSAHTFLDQKVFHLRMGSDWSKHPRYHDMIKETYGFLNEILF